MRQNLQGVQEKALNWGEMPMSPLPPLVPGASPRILAAVSETAAPPGARQGKRVCRNSSLRRGRSHGPRRNSGRACCCEDKACSSSAETQVLSLMAAE